MGERACRSAGNGVSETRGAAFGNDYAVRASGESGSNDGSEVVRVFHTIEQNNQPRLAVFLACAF